MHERVIEMKWLKKLVSLLQGDDDLPVTERQNILENHHDYKHDVKNIETKVAYQYPKGKFRFPVIPDEPRQKKTIRESKKVRESQHLQQEIQRSNKQPFHKSERSENKQPFRPTEIPSPIYGFHKPKWDEMKINEDDTNKQPFRPTEIPSPIYGFHKPNQEETEIKELIEFELPFIHDQKEDIQQSYQEIATAKIAEPIQEDETKTLVEKEEPLNDDQESLDSTPSLILEKSHEEKAMDEGYETNTSTEQLEINTSIENQNENHEEILEPKNEIQEEIQEIKNETLLETKNEKQMPETKIEAQSHTKTSLNTQEQKPKRSYIPYNVIMLKQDKKKWQEKQNSQRQTEHSAYRFPSIEYLHKPSLRLNDDRQWLEEQKKLLDQTFRVFNVRAKVVNVTQGPSVTRFEVQPELGVKVNKITNLSDDIKLSLAAKDIRIEAPIPGKNTIGIEVPNRTSKPVFLREIIQSRAFVENPSPLTVALGLDISGNPVVTDLKKMPHGLIAGATGSGKSVCINAMLISLLYKASPHEVKLMLIDPKMVELAPYNDIPHLVSPVITDVKAATAALKWAVEEMERRYELFAHTGVRDIQRYNELAKQKGSKEQFLPYLVIIIDELADLMMVAPGEVEESICRIAQKARACGIHLILATQRPSVDVITGLIKANIPTRIAFSVSSQVDSRTIIDTNGAEKLLGKGDMLFLENGSSKTLRVQGNFVSDEEIEKVVEHVKQQMKPSYLFQQEELMKKSQMSIEEDDLFYEACEFVVDQGGASTSSLQRRFRIGYNRAARLIEMMEEQGIISAARGSKPREVLITEDELHNMQNTSSL
jgi:DNA segregation ATPase FtsK/SpoIIIE, S-DNA-T family